MLQDCSITMLSMLYVALSPNSIRRNFLAGKVADTNHESRGHEPYRNVKMFATKSVTSPRQTRLCLSNGIWSVTMHGESRQQSPRTLSRTQIMKVGNMICVADFHDLCPRIPPWGGFGESHKIGVMEFGLYHAYHMSLSFSDTFDSACFGIMICII